MSKEAIAELTENSTPTEAEIKNSASALDRAIDELGAHSAGIAKSTSAPPQEKRRKSDSLLMNIPVEVQIVIGSAEMTVGELMNMADGQTVALDRRIGEPVDLIVNGVKVASGEIVAAPDDPSRFAFKISQISNDE